MLLVSLMLVSMSACETTVVSDCSWARVIILDSGYESRLTRGEKVQVLQHNEKVVSNCRAA